VTRYRHGERFDVVGNVWQWTETPIYPFDNFKVHPLYDDFTAPTFDGQHNLIKGGIPVGSRISGWTLAPSEFHFTKGAPAISDPNSPGTTWCWLPI